jgi:hypothetical protein
MHIRKQIYRYVFIFVFCTYTLARNNIITYLLTDVFPIQYLIVECLVDLISQLLSVSSVSRIHEEYLKLVDGLVKVVQFLILKLTYVFSGFFFNDYL